MATSKFIQVSKTKHYLIHDDYIFLRNRVKGSKSYWNCRNSSCLSKINYDGDKITLLPADHVSNESPIEDIISIEFKSEMQSIIHNNANYSGKEIYDDAVVEQEKMIISRYGNDEHYGLIPSYHQVECFIYREKKRMIPSLPHSRRETKLTGDFRKTIKGHVFLLNEQEGEEKIMIFGTQEFLVKLCSLKTVYMDGTFYSCPNHFYQLYTLHGEFKFGNNTNMIPHLFVLLPSKKKSVYLRMFAMIKSSAIDAHLVFNPANFQIDFEHAMISAIKTSFPQSQIHGCFFHYTQAIWRKVQFFKLTNDFKTNIIIKKTIRRVAALPLLPTNVILGIWNNIKREAPDNIALNTFLAYAFNTWVESDSMYARDMWNHFENDSPRTNNHLEGWHSGLNKHFKRARPNIFKFVTILKKIQNNQEGIIERMKAGKRCSRVNNKYNQLNKSIINFTIEYQSGNMTALELLDAIGKLLHLQSHQIADDSETETE